MGDRRQIVIEFGGRVGGSSEAIRDAPDVVVFYTHWGGSELVEDLANALVVGKGRWGDDSYIARIIITSIVAGDYNQETGYGVAPYYMDTEYDDLFVNLGEQTVREGADGEAMSFASFCEINASTVAT